MSSRLEIDAEYVRYGTIVQEERSTLTYPYVNFAVGYVIVVAFSEGTKHTNWKLAMNVNDWNCGPRVSPAVARAASSCGPCAYVVMSY